MAILASDWLIRSDVAHEVAFRIDLPESHQGRWVLSYLPTHRRLTRAQALAGVVLAEMVLLDLLEPAGQWDGEIARIYAGELGLSVPDVLCLLAFRAYGVDLEEAGDPGEAGDGEPESRGTSACPAPAELWEVSR
ncbi:hypothetical protein [Nocardia mexicana]|uniref:Uncharacterized protein n=1 Tax=Nocardia mexicana TaxID=279262 RepID=A0A370H6V5_9NOCA|nr:hypothetical protein [Nocardia mexicana]RDI52093.1 hypothetical protein DFR68_104581 [Nocardia mexicana]